MTSYSRDFLPFIGCVTQVHLLPGSLKLENDRVTFYMTCCLYAGSFAQGAFKWMFFTCTLKWYITASALSDSDHFGALLFSCAYSWLHSNYMWWTSIQMLQSSEERKSIWIPLYVNIQNRTHPSVCIGDPSDHSKAGKLRFIQTSAFPPLLWLTVVILFL